MRRGYCCAAALLVLLHASALIAAERADASVFAAKERELTCSITDGFTLASVGDLLLTQPASTLDDPSFQQLVTILRGADAAFGNFESNAVDVRQFRGYPFGDLGDIWLTAVPELAPDVKRMGFSLVSRANNHSTDWGIDGMRETDRRLDDAGLVHAGTGDNRASARAARYLNTSRGRVALVSMASTFNVWSMAMASGGEAPGRPGLNPLRLSTYSVVTPDMMRSLHKISQSQPPGSIDPVLTPAKPGDLDLLGVHYRTGDRVGFSYEMNEVDRQEILKNIRQGKENSDFLIATIHAHEPGNWSEAPADFLPTLAHQAIDAGADVFIGHGPHRLRGIEIYKGKPIFYSLGNFFYQDQLQQPMSADLYEEMGADPRTVTDAEVGARLVNVYFDSDIYYQSVIAVSTFARGVVSEIRLYPVELGYSRRFADRGVPRRASPALSRSILEGLQRLSQPYGTVIHIDKDVGVIHLGTAP